MKKKGVPYFPEVQSTGINLTAAETVIHYDPW